MIVLLPWLDHLHSVSIEVVGWSILCLFLVWKKDFQTRRFFIRLKIVFFTRFFIRLMIVSLCSYFAKRFMMTMGINASYSSTETLLNLFLLNLLLWWIILVDFLILKQLWIPGINSICSWWIILFTHSWILLIFCV